MKTSSNIFGLCISILIATSVSTPAQGPNGASSPPDEAYFLMRTLEVLYEQWPQDVASPDAFTESAAELRKEAIRLRIRAERADLPRELIASYSDFVSLLDSYSDFLQNIGAIRKSARENADSDNFESGFKGGYAAAGTYGTLSQSQDASTGEAALASLLIGGITYAVDAWGKSGRRDDAERAAVTAAAQKVQDTFTATLERTRQGFHDLARKKGWDDMELGWNPSEAHSKAVLALYSEGNIPGLIREFRQQSSSRPRDPYIRLTHNLYQAVKCEHDAPALLRLSEDSYRATSLIPQEAVYSVYRLHCVSQAALIASAARETEQRSGSQAKSSDSSRRALNLWNEAMRLEPSDPSGYIRFHRACAKGADGDITGAQAEADEVIEKLKDDATCLYGYACILSLNEDYDNSLSILEGALAAGGVDVAEARTDPDFARLATERKEPFRKLVIPQWSWGVTDDWVWDDITLTNNSVYPLTNVTFTVNLKNGARRETLSLKCESMLPGAKQEWTDVVKGADGVWDKSSSASLSCDQTHE